MRRLAPLTLVCALLCLLLSARPSLGAVVHHPPRHATLVAAVTTSASQTSSRPAAGADPAGGKATSRDGLKVLNDCQEHGQLTHTYPVAWLRKALSMMSSDTAQYSNCSTVLHQAILGSIHPGSGGSGGSGGSTIVIIVVVVLVILAALLGGLALRRRRGGPGSPAA